jgi:hypothetical protein
MSSNNEKVIYGILRRRGFVPDLSYAEYLKAAREVVSGIPLEAITPIEEMLTRLEQTIIANRKLNA